MDTDLYPPGLNHADLHISTGDMPLEIVDVVKSAVAGASLVSIHGKASVPAGIDTGSGTVKGLHIEVEVLATGVAGGRIDALKAEVYCPTGSSMGADVAGLHISNFIQVQPTGSYEMARFEENGGITVEDIIGAYVTGDVNYFICLQPGSNTAWDRTGDKATPLTEQGWLRVWVGGSDRYIQLYG